MWISTADLYTSMLGIPVELYHTNLFAIARITGWSAHRTGRMIVGMNKIIRPAYKSVMIEKQ